VYHVGTVHDGRLVPASAAGLGCGGFEALLLRGRDMQANAADRDQPDARSRARFMPRLHRVSAFIRFMFMEFLLERFV